MGGYEHAQPRAAPPKPNARPHQVLQRTREARDGARGAASDGSLSAHGRRAGMLAGSAPPAQDETKALPEHVALQPAAGNRRSAKFDNGNSDVMGERH